MKKYKRSFTLKIAAVILLVVSLNACTSGSRNNEAGEPVSVSNYSTGIVGNWDGTIDGSEETMSLNNNGTFTCHLRKLGFIASTLSQSLPGTVNGNWQIDGTKVRMEITGEKNENVENQNASSEIISMSANRLLLRSDKGDSCTFNRVDN